MIFQSPALLWLLVVPVALAVASSLLAKRDRSRLATLVDFRLLDRLTASVDRRRRAVKNALLLLALTLGIIGLARPTLGEKVTNIQTSGRDVLIAIDVSRSMLANDIAPSRLLRAKMAAEDLISLLPGDRVGLLAFAGSAFLQAPITADHSAVKVCIQELDTEIIPLGGTNVTAAIQEAKRAFKQAEGSLHALVIISDGEDLENDVIQSLKKDAEGIRIFTLGIGTPEGTILSVPSAKGGVEYVRGPDGQIVKSALDEAKLKAIAENTGGFYQRLRSGPQEMRRLFEEGISRMEETMGNSHEQRQPIDRFEWLVAPALALLLLSTILSERRKEKSTAMNRSTPSAQTKFTAALLAVSSLASLQPNAQAANNAAVDAYQKGDFDEAKRLFDADRESHPDSPEHAYNAGTSAYQKGAFAEAVNLFGQALQSENPSFRSKASYNIANSLVKLATSNRRSADKPTLENAITQYEEALRLDPDLSQARENAEKVRDFLKKLDEQKDKGKSSKDKDKGKNQDKKEDKKDEQSQDGKDGDEKDENDGSPGKSDSKDGKKGDSKKSEKSGDNKDAGDEKDPSDQDKESSKDGSGDRKDEKQGSKKDSKSGDKKDADGSNQEQDAQRSQLEKREKGELKSEPQQGAEGAKPVGEGGEQQESEGGTGGVIRMTPQQAQALIDALRAEERRVQLMSPEQRRDGRIRTFKNW